MVRSLVALAVLGFAVTACARRDCYDYCADDDGNYYGNDAVTTPAPAPVLVPIDTDQTLEASPGLGVGIFIEYRSGGHWNLRWTCDTERTGQSCDFDVQVSTDHTVSNALEDGSIATVTTSATGTTIHAGGVITSTMETLTFDATPGEEIRLTASVSGLTDGSFFFFVQDGKINGGYEGTLTNPIRLVGKTP